MAIAIKSFCLASGRAIFQLASQRFTALTMTLWDKLKRGLSMASHPSTYYSKSTSRLLNRTSLACNFKEVKSVIFISKEGGLAILSSGWSWQNPHKMSDSDTC